VVKNPQTLGPHLEPKGYSVGEPSFRSRGAHPSNEKEWVTLVGKRSGAKMSHQPRKDTRNHLRKQGKFEVQEGEKVILKMTPRKTQENRRQKGMGKVVGSGKRLGGA